MISRPIFLRFVWMAMVGTCGVSVASAVGPPRLPFDEGRASFAVQVAGEVCLYRVLALSVLPSETLSVQVLSPLEGVDYQAETAGKRLEKVAPAAWAWSAPAEPGLYPLTILRQDIGDAITLNVFVLVPIENVRDERLEGFRIGSYPAVPLRGLDVYKPPRGFIRVTPALVDTPVSPHFRLRQFLCKQAGDYPKFLNLRPRLLLKLEFLLREVNAMGFRCDTFAVLSGYRTPYYNRFIGNVKYSRHIWGGAADVFIDESPRDGMMDDLNKDNVIDWKDAAVLYELVDGLRERKEYKSFVGGLGRYKKTAAHGPFVHVDVRGFSARWGT